MKLESRLMAGMYGFIAKYVARHQSLTDDKMVRFLYNSSEHITLSLPSLPITQG